MFYEWILLNISNEQRSAKKSSSMILNGLSVQKTFEISLGYTKST